MTRQAGNEADSKMGMHAGNITEGPLCCSDSMRTCHWTRTGWRLQHPLPRATRYARSEADREARRHGYSRGEQMEVCIAYVSSDLALVL